MSQPSAIANSHPEEPLGLRVVYSYDSLFRLPKKETNDVRGYLLADSGLVQVADNPEGRYGNIFNLEPGIIHQIPQGGSLNLSVSMEVTIMAPLSGPDGKKLKVKIPDMLEPLRGLNPQGVPVADNKNFTEVQIYHDLLGLVPVLGRAFLAQVSNHNPSGSVRVLYGGADH